MIKHAQVVERIASGEPFNALYCKANGELTEFTNAHKLPGAAKHLSADAPAAGNGNAAAPAGIDGFLSRIPITTESGQNASIYTRLIIKFNGEDVVL